MIALELVTEVQPEKQSILQRIRGDGMAFVHAGGTVIEKKLSGETLRVDTGCIVAFTSGIDYNIERSGGLKSMFFGGEGLFLATLRGTDTRTGLKYITGAHYDCASNVATNAPGATDNAAGVGVVMELARVMSKYKFKHTLVFAFWNGEERGLMGSTSYAESAKADCENIGLYLNYDSTCFDPRGRLVLDVISDGNSERFKELLVANNHKRVDVNTKKPL